MDYTFLSNTLLFCGMNEGEIKKVLQCIGAYTRTYRKGEVVHHAGELVDCFGLVLSGGITVTNDDLWGNRRFYSYVEPGRSFAELYAFLQGQPTVVRIEAEEDSEVLMLNAAKLLQPCAKSCACHHKLIENVLYTFARKSLALAKRVLNISSRSIRGKLLSFLSQEAARNGSRHFTIEYDRQELADYLGVDRSALCNELSKMRGEGLLTYKKNMFWLNEPPEKAEESGAGKEGRDQ